jgi:aminoglycoside/choline kinase family phosphotransferase
MRMSFLSPPALEALAFPVVGKILGRDATRLITMPGGASLRRYHRVEAGAQSIVVMETGDPQHSDEIVKGAWAELPFVDVQRYLARGGVAVPQIYEYDRKNGLLYIEDLGDVTFESRVADGESELRRRYYRLAIDQLVAMQKFAVANPDPSCVAFTRAFDYDLLKWELDHFREYGLEAQGHQPSAGERELLERHFRAIAERLASEPRIFVHRDYQSRNLMVQDSATGPKLRVIDFQDALLGTRAYDLVGLLRDSYVVLDPPLLDELVGYYVQRAELENVSFCSLFNLQVVQRKLKDAGRFVFIERVKKIPGFMRHIPSSLGYVAHAMSQLPELAELQALLAKWLPSLEKVAPAR